MQLNNKNNDIIILVLIVSVLFLGHQLYKTNRKLDALIVEGMETPKYTNQEAHSVLASMYNNEGTLTVDNLVVTNKAAIGKNLAVGAPDPAIPAEHVPIMDNAINLRKNVYIQPNSYEI
jgi:hypothetical protein